MGYFCDFRKNDIWRMIAVVAVVLAAAAFLISALPDGSDGAGSGKCGDDVTWVLNDDSVLIISGSGPMYNYDYAAFYDYSELVSPFSNKSFEKVIIEYGVTSIGDVAFLDSCILNLEIANSVTYIGKAAFAGGMGLESVVIPDSVSYIGESAFSFNGLKTVVLPDSLSYIGGGAFDNTSIESIELPSALTFIGDSLLFSSPITSITIPPSVTYIGYQAFAWCTFLADVFIPPSVVQIKDGAFEDCRSLSSITIPDSVTSIGKDAFKGIIFQDEGGNNLFPTVENLCGYTFEGSNGVLKRIAGDGPGFDPDGAESGTCGENLIWVLDDDGNLIISGSGDMYDYGYPNCGPWGKEIKTVRFEGSATSIGKYAFYDCTSLSSVSMPSVTSIGDRAFHGCTSLSSVDIPDSVTSIGGSAFYGCAALSSVTIPSSVTSIVNYTFFKCTSLSSVSMPSVTSIGSDAFPFCTSLSSVSMPSVTSIGAEAFYGCTSLSSVSMPSATSIGDGAFNNCTSLSSVSMPSATSIGREAFYKCTSLTSVDIPDSVTSIGGSAFAGCTSLTTADIGNSIISIGSNTFWGCKSLSSVSIPNSVTAIGKSAFYNCISLSSVNIPGSLEKMGKDAFGGIRFLDENGNDLPHTPESLRGYAYEGSGGVLMRMSDEIFSSGGLIFRLDSGSEDAVLVGFSEPAQHLSVPASVSYLGKDYAVFGIGPKAFYGYESLISADLGNVSEIGMKAFARCGSLESVSFGGSLGEIAPYSFFGCGSLASVTIPDSVASIGKSAFSGCVSLTSVAIPGSVASIGENAFYGLRFLDERGNLLDCSAEGLGGYAYEGSCCVLQRAADGFTFVSGGLVFKVDWSGDSDATLVGFSEPAAHLAVPASVTYEGKEYPVSEIGPKAFYGVGELVSADLGSITEIGMKAFARCSSLESVDFGDSLRSVGGYAFYACDSLSSVSIPDSAVSIGKCAFPLCPFLEEVVISDSVETVGDRAFWLCTSLSRVAIGSSVSSIGDQAFFGITFCDESGKRLPATAEALAGHLYEGAGDGRLYRSAA